MARTNTVILRNLKTLKKQIGSSLKLKDLSFTGADSSGNVTVENSACLIQQFLIWLYSDSGDYHRVPNVGGFLQNNVIKKALTKENATIIENELKSAVESGFTSLTLTRCEVVADLAERRWKIRVGVKDKNSDLIDESLFVDDQWILVEAEG